MQECKHAKRLVWLYFEKIPRNTCGGTLHIRETRKDVQLLGEGGVGRQEGTIEVQSSLQFVRADALQQCLVLVSILDGRHADNCALYSVLLLPPLRLGAHLDDVLREECFIPNVLIWQKKSCQMWCASAESEGGIVGARAHTGERKNARCVCIDAMRGEKQ